MTFYSFNRFHDIFDGMTFPDFLFSSQGSFFLKIRQLSIGLFGTLMPSKACKSTQKVHQIFLLGSID